MNDKFEVQALAEQVSDALAATTEGTNYDEAPEPSDEPGSPYVMRLTNELHARGVRVAPSPTELADMAGQNGPERFAAAWVAPSPDAPGPHAQPRPEATLIVKAIDALEQDSDQHGALSFLKAALRATTPDRAALAASGDAPSPTEDAGRWSRGGWHDGPCWREWINNPEGGCTCGR